MDVDTSDESSGSSDVDAGRGSHSRFVDLAEAEQEGTQPTSGTGGASKRLARAAENFLDETLALLEQHCKDFQAEGGNPVDLRAAVRPRLKKVSKIAEALSASKKESLYNQYCREECQRRKAAGSRHPDGHAWNPTHLSSKTPEYEAWLAEREQQSGDVQSGTTDKEKNRWDLSKGGTRTTRWQILRIAKVKRAIEEAFQDLADTCDYHAFSVGACRDPAVVLDASVFMAEESVAEALVKSVAFSHTVHPSRPALKGESCLTYMWSAIVQSTLPGTPVSVYEHGVDDTMPKGVAAMRQKVTHLLVKQLSALGVQVVGFPWSKWKAFSEQNKVRLLVWPEGIPFEGAKYLNERACSDLLEALASKALRIERASQTDVKEWRANPLKKVAFFRENASPKAKTVVSDLEPA